MQSSSHPSSQLERLVECWPRRAGVRRDEFYEQDYGNTDDTRPDYPINIVPFEEHPNFQAASPEQRASVLTGAWLAYNERVIEIEHLVTNPAIDLLLRGTLPGASNPVVRQALQQTLIDEQFHLMMHEQAIRETRLKNPWTSELELPHSIVFRKLHVLRAECPEQWQKDLLMLLWAIVSEMTINAYLNLLSRSDNIREVNRRLNWLHNRDELAHNEIFVEISKAVFRALNPHQRDFFLQMLPRTVEAFTSHDFSSWEAVLRATKLPGTATIIGDCKDKSGKLLSDVSYAYRLLEHLEIVGSTDVDQRVAANSRQSSESQVLV
ncbi:MAG: diiron oxygenase [Myxococcota bacterium]